MKKKREPKKRLRREKDKRDRPFFLFVEGKKTARKRQNAREDRMTLKEAKRTSRGSECVSDEEDHMQTRQSEEFHQSTRPQTVASQNQRAHAKTEREKRRTEQTRNKKMHNDPNEEMVLLFSCSFHNLEKERWGKERLPNASRQVYVHLERGTNTYDLFSLYLAFFPLLARLCYSFEFETGVHICLSKVWIEKEREVKKSLYPL